MRNFLKNNTIAILACLMALGLISEAATLVRPYTSADYAGGAKAVGSKVNTEFDTIVAWINGANIASGNIASMAVPRSKLSGNYAFGSDSGTITITNTSTTLRVLSTATTITTSGRPVRLFFQAPGDASGYVNNAGSGTGQSYIYFIQDSSTVATFKVPQVLNNPCSMFEFVHNETDAGSYVYSAKLSVNYTSGSYETEVGNCELFVEEL